MESLQTSYRIHDGHGDNGAMVASWRGRGPGPGHGLGMGVGMGVDVGLGMGVGMGVGVGLGMGVSMGVGMASAWSSQRGREGGHAATATQSHRDSQKSTYTPIPLYPDPQPRIYARI